mmetsp:Transcript_84231/g.272277  ORF Transcript_84231/g.272277 Transcript_84231/m.272277 type:complete len:206 (+) Transcript_84231:1873-2490(+)
MLQQVVNILLLGCQVCQSDQLVDPRGHARAPILVARAEDPLQEFVELDASVLVCVGHQHDLSDAVVRPHLRIQVLQDPCQLRSIDHTVSILVESLELVHDLVLSLGFFLLFRGFAQQSLDHILYESLVDDRISFGPRSRVALHHLQSHVLDCAGVVRGHLGRGCLANLLRQTCDVRRLEGHPKSTHLVQDAAHGPYIRRPRVRLL